MSYFITTGGGRVFDYDHPTADMISIDDLALGLGNTCRFAGHVERFYSVAEHAVLVDWLLREADEHPNLCLAGLHHDSHEAYLGDVPTPLKEKIKAEAPGVWELMEGSINEAIADYLGIDVALFNHPAIHDADREALLLEANALKPAGARLFNLADPIERSARAERYVIGLLPNDATAAFRHAHSSALLACAQYPR